MCETVPDICHFFLHKSFGDISDKYKVCVRQYLIFVIFFSTNILVILVTNIRYGWDSTKRKDPHPLVLSRCFHESLSQNIHPQISENNLMRQYHIGRTRIVLLPNLKTKEKHIQGWKTKVYPKMPLVHLDTVESQLETAETVEIL